VRARSLLRHWNSGRSQEPSDAFLARGKRGISCRLMELGSHALGAPEEGMPRQEEVWGGKGAGLSASSDRDAGETGGGGRSGWGGSKKEICERGRDTGVRVKTGGGGGGR